MRDELLFTGSLNEKTLLIIFLWMISQTGVTYADQPKLVLSEEQIRLFDASAMEKVPACRFVYNKAPISTVTGNDIYQCIERLNYWLRNDIYDIYDNYESLGFSEQQARNILVLDDYIGKRLLPYAVGIAKEDQAILLRKIAFEMASNITFIQAMIDQGTSVRNILLQQVGEARTEASCESYKPFLNKNISLYQQMETLYEPIPDIDEPEKVGSVDLYSRWVDLYYLVDTSIRFSVCYEIIDKLVKAQPELLNTRYLDGATPLHYYLRGFNRREAADIQLMKTLTTATNINMRSSYGNTPLHEFFNYGSPRKADKPIIKWLISQGANVRLKNKAGITVKNLILQRPDLSELWE